MKHETDGAIAGENGIDESNTYSMGIRCVPRTLDALM